MSQTEDGVDRIQQAWQRERPGMPVSSIGIITRVWRIAKLLEDERRRTDARIGLDAATRDLLSTLRRSGPPYRLAAGEIARQSLVSAGAISQRVARAEQRGLVRRGKGGADGRSVLVELTDAGHQLIEQRVDELLRHEETLLNSLDAGQQEQLTELLRILLRDLGERFGAEDRP
ncbi:MarR family winged helix-turn-helix transcriptional regulator [Saccharopolyspora phatthalungensis]|uniref:DNA-binding MarR family transcriptional regulator n=1 Tax=Saccharopolyspora phatthalungensis TaxID=664693 RepID=A0A840QI41_9PSEU|nr:MarR family transcriptional regulator [Saccharopolyspora phatthalungensis]MBB5158235.1 DNA-binding MarR family transcriptional regulator [Saccharopolyspora phatthalungensis]